jgi:ribonuclease P protein component
MIPQKLRIKTQKLKEIFKQGKKKSFPELSIYYQNNVYSYPRISIVIPKKLHKKAVFRNKIKRRLKHILRDLIKERKIKPRDYVFVVKSIKLKEEKFAKLKEKIEKYINEIPY